jgi:death-on-curing protein
MTASQPKIHYLSASEVVQINDDILEGDAMIRDLHLLDSALLRPALVLFGEPQFPSVMDKAAALMHSLAYHHLFYDGNKRTAVRAVALFLSKNGYTLDYQVERDYDYILEVAKGHQSVEQIAEWLSVHSRVRGDGLPPHPDR